MGFLTHLMELVLFPFVVSLILCLYPSLPPPLSDELGPEPKLTVPLEGLLSLNQKLDSPEILFKGVLAGAESFAAKDGRIYTGVLGGDLVSFDAKSPSNSVVRETRVAPSCPAQRRAYDENRCGRILGLDFDAAGDLLIADAYYGLYKWNLNPAESPKALVPSSLSIDGRPNLITNSVAVSKKTEGFVYFTSSSTMYSLYSSVAEAIGVRSSGRVMRYDQRDGTVTTLVDYVPFANGIQLADDESFLIYASCGYARVMKLHLIGEKKGQTEVFFDPPGIPDNISPAPDGGFFIGLVAVEADKKTPYFTLPSPMRLMRENPLLKTAIANFASNLGHVFATLDRLFPSSLFKTANFLAANTETASHLAPSHALVVRVDKRGNAVEALHGTDGTLSNICEGFAHEGWLYLGSPYKSMDFIARVPWP